MLWSYTSGTSFVSVFAFVHVPFIFNKTNVGKVRRGQLLNSIFLHCLYFHICTQCVFKCLLNFLDCIVKQNSCGQKKARWGHLLNFIDFKSFDFVIFDFILYFSFLSLSIFNETNVGKASQGQLLNLVLQNWLFVFCWVVLTDHLLNCAFGPHNRQTQWIILEKSFLISFCSN